VPPNIVSSGNDTVSGDETSETCTFGSIAEYIISKKGLELFFCILFAALANFIPGLAVGISQRPIPYQKIGSGDIILDQTLNNEYIPETISDTLLVILSIVLPILIQCLVAFTIGRARDVHRSICAYAFCIGSTLLITDFTKRYVGYLRPNTYGYCGFDISTLECLNENEDMNWRLSFPSGHASIAFAGLTMLTLYLSFAISVRHKYQLLSKALSILALSPLLLACYISASRVVDNYHFPADIVAGASIGSICAVACNRIWLPNSFRFAQDCRDLY